MRNGNMPSYKHRGDTAWLGAVVTRKIPNGSDRKTEMCSIFDVYDKCVRKGVKNDCKGDQVMMNRERNAAQTRYSLWWPAQWALYHTTPVTAARSGHSPAHTHKCALTQHTAIGLLHHLLPT